MHNVIIITSCCAHVSRLMVTCACKGKHYMHSMANIIYKHRVTENIILLCILITTSVNWYYFERKNAKKGRKKE